MSNVVPEGWKEHRQGDIADFSNGKAYKLTEWEKEGTPVIRLQNLTGSGKDFYYSNLSLPERQYCTYGDLLYMWSATFGPHIWKGPKAIYHYHIWKITCNEVDLTKQYLFHLLGYKTSEWLNQSNGMGILHITKAGMEDLRYVLPPLPEQKKIAAILTSVDEVIEKTQAQIDKLKDLKTAMMQELLTCGVGVDGKPHTEFKDSPVGRIPKGWEVKRLIDVCSSKYAIVDGPFGSNLKTEHYRTTGIPVFQSGFVTSNKFVKKKYVFVDDDKFKEQKRSSAGPNDILMAKIGMNAGACAIIPSNHSIGILAGNSLKITVDENIVLNHFVLSLLHFMQDTGDIRRLLTETAQPAISITTLKKMYIPIPEKKEQQTIVNALKSIDSKIDLGSQKQAENMKIKKALMQDLLTGKVRVKVD